eukprot:TRINITY_DN17113_c0_g1_i1.p1 TRINITY_DN17113_c0_g1~~TRINITY_DN17113_c0_g1_i1.p1  ORF type:complete len:173 (+),score=65.61 TRINITY_DN17113_c0_g1_i1:400-918(+)
MDGLKLNSGSTVLEIVLQYLTQNASAYARHEPVTMLPIEGLFLTPLQYPAPVRSPGAVLGATERLTLEALFEDLAFVYNPVNHESVRAVHGSAADAVLALCKGEEERLCVEDWMAACEQLVQQAGAEYISAMVARLTNNIEVQEIVRSQLAEGRSTDTSLSFDQKLESMLLG